MLTRWLVGTACPMRSDARMPGGPPALAGNGSAAARPLSPG